MDDKYNIHTIFRMAIPGYLSLLVMFTLGVPFSREVHFIALLGGIPLGFIFQTIYFAYFSSFLGFERRIFENDRENLIRQAVIREKDKRSQNFTKEDDFHYAAAIDFLLQTQKDWEVFHETSRFLFSKMHAYGAVEISIISGIIYTLLRFLWLSPEQSLPISLFEELIFIILWIILLIISVYARQQVEQKILQWRHYIVDTQRDRIKI